MLKLFRRLFLGNTTIEKEPSYCGYIIFKAMYAERAREGKMDAVERPSHQKKPEGYYLPAPSWLELYKVPPRD
jgi:hypothetical protein